MSRRHAGIETRHRSGCPGADGGRCKCKPAYRAEVYSAAEGKRIRKTFPTFAAAKGWREDHLSAQKRNTLRTDPGPTLRKAAADWIAGAEAGTVLNRSGKPYKPSTLRSYAEALRLRVYPELGGKRLREITPADLQKFVTKINGGKRSASTVRNTVMPLQALYRYAVAHGEADSDPTTNLQLPAATGKREKIVGRDDAAALIEAAPSQDRALWATAFYAGLRRAELQALRWRDVDFGDGVIRVTRSWDQKEGEIEPKSAAGRRTVPLPKALRRFLEVLDGRDDPDRLVFGRDADRPYNPTTITNRARAAWAKAKLDPLTLHDCRHTYASLMIDAGANAKALSTYMGHSSITITMDRYGHLMPGNEAEAAARFDRYLNGE